MTEDPVTVDAQDLVAKMGRARQDGWWQALNAVKALARQVGSMGPLVVEVSEVDKLYRNGPMTPVEKVVARAKLKEKLTTPQGLQVLANLIDASKVQSRVDKQTDKELAGLVHMWAADFDALSPEHVLLSNIAERLERSSGGACVEDS